MTNNKFYAMIDDMVGSISDTLLHHRAFQTDAAMSDTLTEISEDLERRLSWLLEDEDLNVS